MFKPSKRAASYTRASVADPSHPVYAKTNLRSKEQAKRQFCNKKPLRFQLAECWLTGGALWMWLPSNAPTASLKYGQNFGSSRISGGDRISSSGQDDLICVKRVQREYEEHMTEISEYKLLVDHSCLHRTIFIHFDIVSLDRWNRSLTCLIVSPVIDM